MRVMLLHKSTAETEAGIIPPMSLIQDVGAMIGEMKQADVFRDGAGLRASSLGVRVTFAGGARTVTPGPFVGRNENPAAFGIFKVLTIDDAVEHATRIAQILGDGEADIRPVTEPWDLGFGERPKDDPTTRYMIVWKADAKHEAAELPSLHARAALGKLLTDLRTAGVFQGGEAFRPSVTAKRLPHTTGKRRVVDGPFAESKELISGFITLEVTSVADALPWAERYIKAVPGIELDVRPLYELHHLWPEA